MNWTLTTVSAALLLSACDGGGSGGGHSDAGDPTCQEDPDCDDGLFCNGTERCMPGAFGANAAGCVAGTPPCLTGQLCEEASAACMTDCGASADADGDGSNAIACGGDDCDDGDPLRYPGNTETCDAEGHDEDCNPDTLGADADGDGFVGDGCCNGVGTERSCGDDCDDTRSGVNPGSPESCNLIDDDCNGRIDEGLVVTFYRDQDSDGYGTVVTTTGCSAPPGFAPLGGDCNDSLAAVNPAAPDGPPGACNDVDDDCDGAPDEGCACVEPDSRDCGHLDDMGMIVTEGVCTMGTQQCVGGNWGTCVDAVLPTDEVCDGTLDEDCDGAVDERVTVDCYPDNDDDGYPPPGAMAGPVCPDPARAERSSCPYGTTDRGPAMGADCNDGRNDVHPGATEACDGADNDCNGDVDQGACPCSGLAGVAARIQICLRASTCPVEQTVAGITFRFADGTLEYGEADLFCASSGLVLRRRVRVAPAGPSFNVFTAPDGPYEVIMTYVTSHYEGFTFDLLQSRQ